MLTPREYDQIQISLFAMARTKINGRVMVDSDHIQALIKSYTEGNLVIVKDGETLDISFTTEK